MRIAQLGAGRIGSMHLDMLAELVDPGSLVIADLDHARAEAVAASGDGIRATSPAELYEAQDVDVVLNLTVPRAHADVSAQAIAAGKHVYSEKPLATDLAAGRELVDLAAAAGRLLLCAPAVMATARFRLLSDLLASGRVAPHIDGVYPLGDVAGALRQVADRQSAGKVLVDPSR